MEEFYTEEDLAEIISEETLAHPERDDYISFRDDRDGWLEKNSLDTKKYTSILKAKMDRYVDSFHTWLAVKYPHLLFESTNDDCFWLYNKKTGSYDALSAIQVRDNVLRLLLNDNLINIATASLSKKIIDKYRAIYTERGKRLEDFDANPNLFHFTNGWYNLDRNEFKPNSPDRLSLIVPTVEYNKDAKCPIYDKFLEKDAHLSEDDIDLIDQFSGYLLTGDISQGKMLVLVGKSGSGKSTLAQIWTEVLGDFATRMTLASLSNESLFRFAGSQLAGRRMAHFDETELNRSSLGNSLGTLITNDTIRVERKGVQSTSFPKSNIKVVLSANHLPASAEVGIYRRMLIVQFNHSFYDNGTMDVDFMNKLKKEKSGIANRMIRGLVSLRKTGNLIMTEGMSKLIDDYRAESNSMDEFLSTFFDPTDMEMDDLMMNDVRTAYLAFTGNTFQLTPQRFNRVLNTKTLKAYDAVRSDEGLNRRRIVKGIKLREGYSWHDDPKKGRILLPDDDKRVQQDLLYESMGSQSTPYAIPRF